MAMIVRKVVGAAALAALMVAGASPAARAQSTPLNSGPGAHPMERIDPDRLDAEATSPDATAIIRSLAPFADGNPGPGGDRTIREIDDGPRKVRVDYGRAIDLTVFFAFDSSRLTPEARIQLEPLGRALQSRQLAPYRFLIGGHTDARGGALYNASLSFARAMAVKAHLVETYGIDPARLIVHGFGQSRPKDPAHPFAGVNRRVEVALVDPKSSRLEREEGRYVPARAGWSDDDGYGCGLRPLPDPRSRAPYALDDFGAGPTELPCDRSF